MYIETYLCIYACIYIWGGGGGGMVQRHCRWANVVTSFYRQEMWVTVHKFSAPVPHPCCLPRWRPGPCPAPCLLTPSDPAPFLLPMAAVRNPAPCLLPPMSQAVIYTRLLPPKSDPEARSRTAHQAGR